MKNDRTFLRCEICGNLVGMIEDSGVSMVCCGQEMQPLSANTQDAAQEKHVPVAKRDGEQLRVCVGSDAHPMSTEHKIDWIAVAQDGKTQRATLTHEMAPEAAFCVEDGPVTVYAYCNLHGLWATEA